MPASNNHPAGVLFRLREDRPQANGVSRRGRARGGGAPRAIKKEDMRGFGQLTLVLCLAGVVGLEGQGPARDAAGVLARTREALGGEGKLAAVKTFVVTGRTRRVQGINLVPVEFEIAVELPDKYVRKDEIPAQESGPTSLGFNGDAMIQLPLPVAPPPRQGGAPAPGGAAASPPRQGAPATGAPASPPGAAGPPPAAAGKPPAGMPPGARAGGPPVDPRRMRLLQVKQDFVKLTLGMFATSFPSYPLTFTLAGQAEAPQGKAEVIDIKGEGNLAWRLFVNSQTSLPIMVSWTTPATNVVMMLPGQPAPKDVPPGAVLVEAPALPPPTATKEEQDKYTKDVQALRAKALATAKPVENRIYYSDYRDAGNGVMFPFRLRRAVGTETVEETTFDQFRINARIDPRKFEVAK